MASKSERNYSHWYILRIRIFKFLLIYAGNKGSTSTSLTYGQVTNTALDDLDDRSTNSEIMLMGQYPYPSDDTNDGEPTGANENGNLKSKTSSSGGDPDSN